MSQINNEKQFWRGLEGQEDPLVVESFKSREFQENASVLEDAVSRRTFMKLMGATTALAGLTGCGLRKPVQKIYPYAKMPEEILPGRPLYYSTSMAIGREVVGLVVETNEGRPTKIEGNPRHASNKGKTNALHQASVLDLYDPDRLQRPQHDGKDATWAAFSDWISDKKVLASRGSRAALLVESSMSPLYHSSVEQFRRKFPRAAVYRYDAINNDSLLDGVKMAFTQSLIPRFDFSKASIILSFGDDFLSPSLGSLPSAAGYASRRDPDVAGGMSRLYVLESSLSPTGAKADHRVRVKTANLDLVVSLVASNLFANGLALPARLASIKAAVDRVAQKAKGLVDDRVMSALVSDLLSHRGASILTGGPSLSPQSQALIHIVNNALQNTGKTISYFSDPFAANKIEKQNNRASISALSDVIDSGGIDTLFIVGGNPVYNAYADSRFTERLSKVQNVVHLTTSFNETSAKSSWVLPKSHYLESWGDLLSDDGQYSVVQPMIRPMYDTKTAEEFISLLRGVGTTDYKLLRQGFNLSSPGVSWKSWLHNGVVSRRVVARRPVASSRLAALLSASDISDDLHVEVVLDSRILDGRYSNSSWLQEVPDTITKLTWDNALLLSPATAAESHVKTGDMVKLIAEDASLTLPVMVVPGYADNDAKVALGFGRTHVGVIGQEVGFNVSSLWTSEGPRVAKIEKTGDVYELVTTQAHGSMHGRPIFREANLDEYKKDPEFAKHRVHHPEAKSLWEDRKYDTGYQWGMSIDLSKCTGCNACLVACQSENNIPIVGKDQVANGREMHWIRIDRYFEGDEHDRKVAQMPVTCMHCENAPCEQVCPVAATVHSEEGTNDMAYNRCIGTRYCADNCPVKVRRFNFFDYQQRNPQSVKKEKVHLFDYLKEPNKQTQKQFNPDVTVRMRGVMEKCTFCIQRINQAKSEANVKGKGLVDGDVVTACQQACPTDAIVFGDIRNKDAKVTSEINKKRGYHLLSELNLRPRTTYLGSVRNEHPELVASKPVGHHDDSHSRSEH